ncbi:MAG: prenyltransferase/squalene oxidase repeat-containing protein [Verrucomicrobiota bacterium]
MRAPFFIALLLGGGLLGASAQDLFQRKTDPISNELAEMYLDGLQFLVDTQSLDGSWPDNYGSEPGVVGLAVAAMLAHGNDPNHGPYADAIQRGLDHVLSQQNEANGYIGNSMYNHGFATLALAECYGAVEDARLGPALQLAVDLILSSQERNPRNAWRYNPDSRDADTTVSGAQVVALFAARNAGINVPDDSFIKALGYYDDMRTSNGGYGYTSAGGPNQNRTAIGTLAFALAKKTDFPDFQKGLDYLTQNLNYRDRAYPYYFEYYMSQALFHADFQKWEEWNEINIRYLSATQAPDGSWPGNKGTTFSTAGALLSLALNYRFLPIYER